MNNSAPQLFQKLCKYCNILEDEGQSCGKYVEQIKFQRFPKMADEQAKPLFTTPLPVLKRFGRDALLKLEAVVCENLRRATCLSQSIL